MQNFYQSDLNKLFIFEIFAVLLISVGAIDRIFSFLLLAMLAAFFITKPFKESLQLFLLSVPLYIALPITHNADSTSLWRPLSLLLFICWLWERRDILWLRPLAFWEKFLERKHLLYLTIAWFAFIGIAIISLLWAKDIAIGLKTIIYFINIFIVLFIYAWEINRDNIDEFLRCAGLVNGVALFIGFVQFAITFVISLSNFWEWWARYPIDAYYGHQTSHLLTYSNTWFSYYGKNIPATLRMFSIFQDSHAFAMVAIWGVATWGIWYFLFHKKQDKKGRFISAGLIAANLLAIILSGSRGAWMGALLLLGTITLALALQERITRLPALLLKKGFFTLLIFFLLFPVSTLILATSQQAQLFIEGRAENLNLSLAFWRARSTFDTEELSNKGRLEIWKDSFRYLNTHYFIKGTGIGNFSTVLDLSPDTSRLGASAHSLYLQILTELGLVGLLIFLGILLLILYHAYTKRKSLIAMTFLFAFCWILFYSLVDVTLLNDKILLLTAIFIGLLYASPESYENH